MKAEQIELSSDLQHSLSSDIAWLFKVIPKKSSDKEVCLLINSANINEDVKNELQILLGKNVEFEACESSIIDQALSKYYRKTNEKTSIDKSDKLTSSTSDDFLQKLIIEARNLGSSDIHIEAYNEKCRIRIRIDGHLIERYSISKTEYPSLINKIKIKANLDISEKRLPQDGRIFFNIEGYNFDIRVSILPALYGEKIVLRLLSNDATNLSIHEIGFSDTDKTKFLEAIHKPHGLVLISGPTGSGKTTTLYSSLKLLNKESHNILTIEDPIEYTLDGINQVQLKESIGLTFASALRTFLRQDPDIIMLGEIRDGETAQMAIRAALTGHLVLSTIHTNSAWGTISRLIDMGVPEYLISNTLNLSAAQRLVRLLCNECKTEETISGKTMPIEIRNQLGNNKTYKQCGCASCYYTGYKGRKAIYELISVDPDVSNEIRIKSSNIQSILAAKNFTSLSQNAIKLFINGETSLEEIYPYLTVTDMH